MQRMPHTGNQDSQRKCKIMLLVKEKTVIFFFIFFSLKSGQKTVIRICESVVFGASDVST